MSKSNESGPFQTVHWVGDAATGFPRLIDQTRLPNEYVEIDCRDVPAVWEAIKSLRVRGAPAIGVAAAYGAVIGARTAGPGRSGGRPSRAPRSHRLPPHQPPDRRESVLGPGSDGRRREPTGPIAMVPRSWNGFSDEARLIDEEDRAMCRSIGRHGAALVGAGQGILTHCNAGGLATADYGTALAVVFTAHEQGKAVRVFADETRPLLQGARLTAWELQRRGIPVTLICDNMAAQVMREGKVQMVVVGADRIASNGDTANKIGTYGVALLAKAHGIPFYVAAPSSTFDLSIADGSAIPIEQRDPREVTHGFGRQTAPEGIDVYNPAFDVTPAELIAGIITEKGVIRPVNAPTIREVLGSIAS